MYCFYRTFYLWKFVMYLLEPDCVLVGRSIMCIITPNSIPNVYNASPYWILSNMIMSMQIYILQKAIHNLRIKEISNSSNNLEYSKNDKKCDWMCICSRTRSQLSCFHTWSLIPYFSPTRNQMKVHLLCGQNTAKHWNPTSSTWEYRIHVFPIKLITRKHKHLLIKFSVSKCNFHMFNAKREQLAHTTLFFWKMGMRCSCKRSSTGLRSLKAHENNGRWPTTIFLKKHNGM